MINKGKVAAFVDNVLVGTEIKEGHNEIVEEVLRRLEENNLYVKLEKCMQKVRWVSWSCHRIQQDRDREGESRQSTKLARTKKCKRCQKVLRPYRLLQEVYQGLCSSNKTNKCTDKKEYQVVIERQATPGI